MWRSVVECGGGGGGGGVCWSDEMKCYVWLHQPQKATLTHFFDLIMGNKEKNEENNKVSSLNRESSLFTSNFSDLSPLNRESRFFRDRKYFLKNLRHLNIFGNCHCVTFLQY